LNNKVLNRVVPDAILGRSNSKAFLNPGGDALWPAPEGTCFGYEYATGSWRVPPAITGAVWEIVGNSDNYTIIRAEIDLVNNLQKGIPCEFERHINVESGPSFLVQNVTEIIRYIGKRPVERDEFMLAPWSLCQFDSGAMGKVVMPATSADDIWDLYTSSESLHSFSSGHYTIQTDTPERFQLGIGPAVEWIEYTCGNEFRVRRSAGALPAGQQYIDISDAPPDKLPTERGVKLSVYCDPSGFMEIEACGGSPDILEPGMEMKVDITTEYRLIN